LFEGRMQARIDAGSESESHLVLTVLLRGFGAQQHCRHDSEVMSDRRP
jgi:hypothetical protein